MYQELRTNEVIKTLENVERILNVKFHYKIIEHEDGTRYVVLPLKENNIDENVINTIHSYGLDFEFDDLNAYIISLP